MRSAISIESSVLAAVANHDFAGDVMILHRARSFLEDSLRACQLCSKAWNDNAEFDFRISFVADALTLMIKCRLLVRGVRNCCESSKRLLCPTSNLSLTNDGGRSCLRIWNRNLIENQQTAIENQQSDKSSEPDQVFGQLDKVILGEARWNP